MNMKLSNITLKFKIKVKECQHYIADLHFTVTVVNLFDILVFFLYLPVTKATRNILPAAY